MMLTEEIILIITIIIIILILLTDNKKNKYNINNKSKINQESNNIYYRNSHSVYIDNVQENKVSKYKKYRYDVNNYKIKEKLLKNTEIKFYNILKSSINNNFIICPKVKISNFIGMKIKLSWEDYYDKINYQSIDFLICNNLFKPIFGIILFYGDFQIQTEDEKNLNEIYNAIKFPILHLKINDNFEENIIKEKIENYIEKYSA
ncbi:hypothetical protein SDC9_180776 [bioreactor metagenome]|uniref:DUF2726 domain-containing protein n=1 Tax=bioreactor metagenome TaxID=1076179 RepID=A0A645H2N3_9ZZZZ